MWPKHCRYLPWTIRAPPGKVRQPFSHPKSPMVTKHSPVSKRTSGAQVLRCTYHADVLTIAQKSFRLIFSFDTFGRYNITTGQYPFEGDNIYRLLENIGKNQWIVPEWFQKFDSNLANLILGMLQANPLQRFSLEQIKQHPWVLFRLTTANSST